MEVVKTGLTYGTLLLRQFILLVFTLLTGCASSQAPTGKQQDLRGSCESRVSELAKDERKFDQVSSRIEAGERKAISAAARISLSSDGYVTKGLMLALGQSIISAPKDTLSAFAMMSNDSAEKSLSLIEIACINTRHDINVTEEEDLEFRRDIREEAIGDLRRRIEVLNALNGLSETQSSSGRIKG